MKIESGRGVSSSGSARRTGRTAAPGFAPDTEAPHRAQAAAPASAVASLEAILALQVDGDNPRARRAHQLKRGHAVLDALERLAKGIALGSAPATLLAELEALRRATETTGEAALDAALLEIDTRLAVELAKLDMALQGAGGRA